MYALFKDDKQIGKAYPTRGQVLAEAQEKGVLLRSASDFGSVVVTSFLADAMLEARKK